MRTKTFFATLALTTISILAILAIGTKAQVGCCCDPITFNGSFLTQAQCLAINHTFIGPPPNLTVTCSDWCNATLAPAPPVVPPAPNCQDPNYNPPVALSVSPVKGKKQLRLSMSLPCPANYVNVSRCKGTKCTDFALIAQTTPTTTYTDHDVLWNTDYTYQAIAHYEVSGSSQPSSATGNAGNIECWNQENYEFCIADYYYLRFEDYLKKHGYAGTTRFAFRTNFLRAVQNTFSNKFNKAWACNAQNQLYQPPGSASCSAGQYCVADEQGSKCVTPTVCEQGGGTFGLYYDRTSCEGTFLGQNYCFFDRSKTSVNKCYDCNPRMTCADYRSRTACERDNCRAGKCAWKDVIPSIGIGVCVDTRFSNCDACTSKGTPEVESIEGYNNVFDQCTQAKAQALTTTNNTCFYNKQTQTAMTCAGIACMDYTPTQCNAPATGIQLNPDNTLKTRSADICGIKVCDFINNKCVKNHAGNAKPDCPLGNRECELDYFPPNTSLLKIGTPNKIDWLMIKILDKHNKTVPARERQGLPDYRVKLCLVTSNNSCNDASQFTVTTTMDALNLNDLALQEWQTALFNLKEGQNTLKYFGIDPSNNPETIKQISFPACDRCQGPKVLNTSVSKGRLVNQKWFTYSETPVITVTFNELATITSASLVKGANVIPLSVIPGSGANYEYQFVPMSPVSDGEYVFTFNAHDKNNIYMDVPGSLKLVVDTTPGDISFVPKDKTIINKTQADITITASQQVILKKFVLEEHEFINKYGVKKKVIDLLPDVSTADNKTYTTTATSLAGGKHVIKVEAEELSGLPVIAQSTFWVSAGPLKIRLAQPSWGTSSKTTFDVVVETTLPVECKYLYDVPTAPPTNTFEFMASFDTSTKITHTIKGFDKISAFDTSLHNLFVYCKQDQKIVFEKFELGIDTTPPNIRTAFAQPKTIIERLIPAQNLFLTTLKVQTDDKSFCKYDEKNVPFVLMKNEFPGFEQHPKQSHSTNVTVTQENKTYTYFVACKNRAELPSSTAPIKFSVDLSVPFSASVQTPRYTNTTNINLRVATNKRAFCYYGTTPDTVLECMGACAYGYSHLQNAEVNASGTHTWYVKCSTGATGEVTPALNITVTVDTTPPWMEYVNDSSNLEETPEISYFPDQLRVSFLGKDNETSVIAYWYSIKSLLANQTVLNWTLSTQTNGTPFYITGLSLVDGATYKVYVKPQNTVGLVGDEMGSDGVTINTTMQPDACQNGVLDGTETDVDCGGECAGCLEGSTCSQNTDCISGYCADNTCQTPTCTDGVQNGKETSVDCGGNCPGCAQNQSCAVDDDCLTGACIGGTCGTPDSCADGVLTGTEGDVDCGGTCPAKCEENQNCNTDTDCAEGLSCTKNTCTRISDSDNDGIRDDLDQCPNTPTHELADENGCSPSQKFSCNDEINDAWRIKYFGSVLCTEDGSPSADPDNDELTNSEEFDHNTDPTEPDTDFDGWNDKVEIEKGFDPLNPKSHPASKLKTLFITLLVMIALAGIGVGGYLGYKWFVERKALPPRPPPPTPKPVPLRKRPTPRVEAVEKLREFAKKPEKEKIDKDWVTLKELGKRVKEKQVSPEVFEKLREVIKGKVPRKEAPKLIAEIRKKEPDAFDLLRKIRYEKLSPGEKEMIKKQFEMLKKGMLGKKEKKALFEKLNLTAKWYWQNKEKLEKELKKLKQ